MPGDNKSSYWIKDPIEQHFFENPQFCTNLKKYLLDQLSIQVEINSQDSPTNHRVYIENESKNTPEMQQAMYNCIYNLFKTIKAKSKQYDDKVSKWFPWLINNKRSLIFLEKLVNTKFNDTITIFIKSFNSLHIYSASKQLSINTNIEKIEYFIEHEIALEAIPFSLPYGLSSEFQADLEEIESNQTIQDEVLFESIDIFLRLKRKQIILFGYDKKVNETKEKILDLIEKNIPITYQLNIIDRLLIEYLFKTNPDKIRRIQSQDKNFGISIRLELNEFSSPLYLKNEVESSIQQLLSETASSTIKRTFESIQLFQDIAEQEKKYLKFIAKRNHCYIKTQMKHTNQVFSLPKASIPNIEPSKSIITQSELFCSSTNVFKKMIVGNGSIELHTGDIALQKEINTIIQEQGVIERAGQFDYEKTHLQTDGTMYTETDGGKLNCKRILFSNWIPTSLIDNTNVLRLSIQSFIAKSIEYTKDTQSIAFAVPDSCTDEIILAKEMINEAKRQLENDKLQLQISFVLLPEQKTLYEQFSNLIETTENIYLYFNWPMTICEITLIGSDEKAVIRCEEKITKYLSRSLKSTKITSPNGIFQSWDQHRINSFYKYCIDRCILLKFNETEQNEIELIGPISGIEEAKKKFYIISELVKDKLQSTSIIERPNSAIRSRNNNKIYSIVVNFNPKDKRKCQRLINRLIEEGFSVGLSSNLIEDKHSQMDKCDCIIVCISQNSYENLSFIEEIKYAFKTDKKVFLVKIQNNLLFGWNDDLFEKQLFFQSFGSENYFDLEYGRLLLELLRYTKPGFTSLLQRRSNFIQQNYDDSHQISNITSTRQLSFIEEFYLQKLLNIPKSNVLLLSVFHRHAGSDETLSHIPANNDHIVDLYTQSILSKNLSFRNNKIPDSKHQYHTLSKKRISPISVGEDQSFKHIEQHTGISQVSSTAYSTIDFIPRRRRENFKDFYFGHGLLTEAEIEKRRKFENVEKMKHVREKLAKYFMEAHKHYSKEQLDGYLEFAQRMKDNTTSFEMFCSKNAIEN